MTETKTVAEAREAYDKALEAQKDHDCNRGELIAVTLQIYAGHAASHDSQTTVLSALQKAQELIRRVDEKVGERPKLLPYPERDF